MKGTDQGGAPGSKSPRDAGGAPGAPPERWPAPGPAPEGETVPGPGAAGEEAAAAGPGEQAGAVDPTNGQPEVADLGPDEQLAEARRERDEYLELAQRSRAEFENFRRRAAEESRAAELRGRAAVAKGLIGGLDNLERALQAAGIDPDASEPADESSSDQGALAHGVALVYRELRSALSSAGVESYDPTGERFDPTVHEAIATRPGDGESGVVVETVHKGYRLDGQLLRAAGVLVSE